MASRSLSNTSFLKNALRAVMVGIAGLATIPALSQPAHREIVSNNIEWISATSNVKVSNRLTVILDGQFRFCDFSSMQHQARIAPEFKINDHWSVIPLGYVYTWNYKYGNQPVAFRNNEHRIYEQVQYKHKLGPLKIEHRVRLEQRMIEVHSRPADVIIDEGYTNKQNRLRYRFLAKLPINSKTIDPKTLFASVYDEVFYSWGKTVTFKEPDQNRVFAGVGYQFDDKFSLQGGAMYHLLIKSNGTKQENNVGFQVVANYNINAMRKR